MRRRDRGFGWAWALLILCSHCTLDRIPKPAPSGSRVRRPAGIGTGAVVTTGGDIVATGGGAAGGMIATGGNEALPAHACDLRGTWALKAEVDVVWGGRTNGLAQLTDNGRGIVTALLRLDVQDVATDGTMTATSSVCDVELPPFYATIGGLICESYQPLFSAAIWQSAKNPVVHVASQASCATVEQCSFAFDSGKWRYGIELPDSATFPSPANTMSFECGSGKGRACFPDHDDDGAPGVEVSIATRGTVPSNDALCADYELRAAPISDSAAAIIDGARRTDRLQIGLNAQLVASFTMDGCNLGHGAGTAAGFNSRAVGCLVEPGTFDFFDPTGLAGPDDPCTEPQRQFMDESLPLYTMLNEGDVPPAALELSHDAPSVGARYTLVRVDSPKRGCESVQNLSL